MRVVATKGRHEASVWRDDYGEWVWTCDCAPEIYGGYALDENATGEATQHVEGA
jgi:hypothetical protein